jgi:hypothetical protein
VTSATSPSFRSDARRSSETAARSMQTDDREIGATQSEERLLRDLKGFRVEWTDGVTGIADGVVLLVRTVGFGTGRSRLESVAADDVVKILFDERRIIVRAYEPGPIALGGSLRRFFRFRRRGA